MAQGIGPETPTASSPECTKRKPENLGKTALELEIVRSGPRIGAPVLGYRGHQTGNAKGQTHWVGPSREALVLGDCYGQVVP
jgi:hypothetical protein